MDLFVINRFLGDDRTAEITSLEERDRLARLLSKVEERKLKKGSSSSKQETGNVTLDTEKGDTADAEIQNIKKSKKNKKAQPEGQENDPVIEKTEKHDTSSEDLQSTKKNKKRKKAVLDEQENDPAIVNKEKDGTVGEEDLQGIKKSKKKKKIKSEGQENDPLIVKREKYDTADVEELQCIKKSKNKDKILPDNEINEIHCETKKKIKTRKREESLLEIKDEILEEEKCFLVNGNNEISEESPQKEKMEKKKKKKQKPIEGDQNAELKALQNSDFTVLGQDHFEKKSKVKRVLPYWLANPTLISVNLQKQGISVDDIPGLSTDLIHMLKQNNVHHFFPVQSVLIPWLLAANSKPLQYRPCDVCVSSPTGSGKTLAFVLPIIQALKERVVPHIRALVILPVQDLAVQVFKVFRKYCLNTTLKVALITGQNSFQKEQEQLLRTSQVLGTYSAVDIVVTTPGRLVDHIQCTPGFSLKHLRFLVIDEADRVMESVQNDWLYHVEKHINSGVHPFLTVASLQTDTPPPQKLLFSATLSQDPEKLQQLGLFQPKLFTSVVADKMHEGFGGGEIRGDFIGKYTTPAELQEKLCIVDLSMKPLVLYHLIVTNNWQHVLCFANSQQAAHRLALLLTHLSKGKFKVSEISSALKRPKRDGILQKFAEGEYNVLISTDALARGMDIPGVDYVISYDPPKYVKTYIHRIGRTGRAGRSGTGVTFLLNNQLSHFQQTLHSAGKTSMDELKVTESDLEPYEEQYKEALEALKQDLLKELRRTKTVKR